MPHNVSLAPIFVAFVTAAAATLLASACTTAPAPETSYVGNAENGQTLAEHLCASCHAIGAVGDSPRATAPPLRTVLADYPPEQLADDLQHAKHIAFLRMPQFHLGEHGGADIVAYIETLGAD